MTDMPDDERIAWIIAAASQLRVPVSPPMDLWPTIVGRLSAQPQRNRRGVPWVTVVIVCLLLFIGGSILISRVASYREARARSAYVSNPALRLGLERAGKIESDHDRATALIRLVESSRGDTTAIMRIIQTARPISSSTEKSNVLVKLGESRSITTQSLRQDYIRAANSISSKADRERALDALDR